jgi:RHS repeat-associated protein
VETRTLDTAGSDPAPPQLIRYQFGNHLGSASLELDDQAQIICYEEYTPYGSTSYQAVRSRTETPKRYRYTGKERDEESGLYYHGARYYAPWLGRWTSCDPTGLGDGVNLLAYGQCNPVRFTDQSGTQSDETELTGVQKKEFEAQSKEARKEAAKTWCTADLEKQGIQLPEVTIPSAATSAPESKSVRSSFATADKTGVAMATKDPYIKAPAPTPPIPLPTIPPTTTSTVAENSFRLPASQTTPKGVLFPPGHPAFTRGAGGPKGDAIQPIDFTGVGDALESIYTITTKPNERTWADVYNIVAILPIMPKVKIVPGVVNDVVKAHVDIIAVDVLKDYKLPNLPLRKEQEKSTSDNTGGGMIPALPKTTIQRPYEPDWDHPPYLKGQFKD